MRLLACLAGSILLGAAPASQPPPSSPARMPVLDPAVADRRCPETPMSLARRQGEGPMSRDLVDLPPAQVFAAVDRRVDGCPAPMLMSEVRR